MKRTALRKVNPARRKSEFARCYHSKERVAWVRSLPSVVSGKRPCINAHIKGDGAGRKADAEYIVPLTDAEHRELHRIGKQSFEDKYSANLDRSAAEIESLWFALAKSLRRAWLEQEQES